MKIKELRQKSKDELQSLVIEKREGLRAMKFELSSGKVKNVRDIRTSKKDIAKILTLLKS